MRLAQNDEFTSMLGSFGSALQRGGVHSEAFFCCFCFVRVHATPQFLGHLLVGKYAVSF